MAKFRLSDIFVGNFPFTQGWGARPSVYAQWGQDGHNGWDWVMPNGSLIVSPADGTCIKSAEERNSSGKLVGFGRYCKILHKQNGEFFVSVYAHLQSVEVNTGQEVKKHQLIAKSDDNGFSSAPHLHFGVYLSNGQGVKIESNGFGGYHNPGDKEIFEWVIEDIKNPYTPTVEESIGVSEDARRALGLLEGFQKAEGHGNLEGSLRALLEALEGLRKQGADFIAIKRSLKERDDYIQVQNGTILGYKDQIIQLAKKMGVDPELPLMMSELTKMMQAEDTNTALQRSLDELRNKEGENVGKVVLEWKTKLDVAEKKNEKLEEDVTRLKARRNLDKYTSRELYRESVLKFKLQIKRGVKNTWQKVKQLLKKN